MCKEILVLKKGRLMSRQTVNAGSREVRQVFEVEGFGNEEAFLAGLKGIGAEISVDGRLYLVVLDLARLTGKTPDEAGAEGFDTAVGVNAILGVASRNDFALRRLRRQPISLADEFYKMVEA